MRSQLVHNRLRSVCRSSERGSFVPGSPEAAAGCSWAFDVEEEAGGEKEK